MINRLMLGAAGAALLLAACGEEPAPQPAPEPAPADEAVTETETAATDTAAEPAPAGTFTRGQPSEEALAVLASAEAGNLADLGGPFAEAWTENYGLPPYAEISDDDYLPAYEAAIADHAAEMQAIADNPDAPTFENTMIAMELAGRGLSRVGSAFGAKVASFSNDQLQDVQRQVSPMLARHSASITLNENLFARVDELWTNVDSLGLDDQQRRLIEVTHDNFVRAGAQLEGDDRERYAELRSELSELYTSFAQNEQRDREAWSMPISDEDLADLPSSLRNAARAAGEARGADGAVITLDRSLAEPFLESSPNRELREEVWRGFYNRGNNDNEFDNKDTIREILVRRQELANMLGFESWAHYRTAGTMAETPEAAITLMDQVWEPALGRAMEELADIQAMIEEEGGEYEAEGWDWRYYTEKVRAERYDLDPAEVEQYLDLERLIEAQFYTAERLFGVTFREIDVELYHPDARVWEMLNPEGEVAAIFVGDYFSRTGKRGGAWMSSFRAQNGITGDIPLIINNCNYNKPPEGEPALISFTDASTLFHEFGHGLHGLLSDVDYPSLAGTSVDRDFVEFPAQILEHWLEQPQILEQFALHHETGEPMPAELLERILSAQTFNEGFATVEFLNSGFVDMEYHLHDDPMSIDVEEFEAEVLASRDSPRQIPMRHRSTHFLHSFSGEGYAAGYYSYMWAGVLDNDGFAAFEEAGDIFDPETARRLQDVLSGGNTRPAMDMYTGFRGREPSVEPLLRNRGFLSEAEG